MSQQPYYPPPAPPPPPAQPYYPPPAPQQGPPVPPQQPYYPPQYPNYAPGQYGPPPAPPQVPQQPLAQGTLDDYYTQPATGGGGGLKFTDANNQPMIGQSYVGRVTRALTAGDVQQQTDQFGKGLTWKDGRPKFVMIVPLQLLEPSQNHPDGLAKWYVKGAAREELSRAMAEAEAPEGAPEAGAVIRVTLTGTRQSGPGMNPAHVFAVQYWRPEGAEVVPAVSEAPPAVQHVPPPPAPAEPYQQPQGQPYQQPQYQAPAAQQAPQAQQPPQAQLTPPAELSADQQQLLAELQRKAEAARAAQPGQ